MNSDKGNKELRIDKWLFEQGFVRSRSRAIELIKSGCVQYYSKGHWELVDKPSFFLKNEETQHVRVQNQEFVSRSGMKLEKALEKIKICIEDFLVLDVGQSTGGFTDCLLQRGAGKVVGIDVGHKQLADELKENEKIDFFEGIHVCQLESSDFSKKYDFNRFDFIVVDVSFISLKKVLPVLPLWLKPEKTILALVKPQFEVGAAKLNKSGVVKDPSLYRQIQKDFIELSDSLKLKVMDYFSSERLGKEGNQEFFIWLQKR